MSAALKPLSDYPSIQFISVLASVDCHFSFKLQFSWFFVWQVIWFYCILDILRGIYVTRVPLWVSCQLRMVIWAVFTQSLLINLAWRGVVSLMECVMIVIVYLYSFMDAHWLTRKLSLLPSGDSSESAYRPNLHIPHQPWSRPTSSL